MVCVCLTRDAGTEGFELGEMGNAVWTLVSRGAKWFLLLSHPDGEFSEEDTSLWFPAVAAVVERIVASRVRLRALTHSHNPFGFRTLF